MYFYRSASSFLNRLRSCVGPIVNKFKNISGLSTRAVWSLLCTSFRFYTEKLLYSQLLQLHRPLDDAQEETGDSSPSVLLKFEIYLGYKNRRLKNLRSSPERHRIVYRWSATKNICCEELTDLASYITKCRINVMKVTHELWSDQSSVGLLQLASAPPTRIQQFTCQSLYPSHIPSPSFP